jgi:bla regulator protein blaR1
MNALDAPWLIRHLADAALRALVPGAAAALFLVAFRVRHAALRLAVWTGVLYAALAVPFLGLLLPPIHLRVPAGFLAMTGIASQAGSVSAASVLRVGARGSLPAGSLPVIVRTQASSLTRTRAAAPEGSRLENGPARIAGVSACSAGFPACIRRAAGKTPGRQPVQIASLTASDIVLGVYSMIVLLLLARLSIGFMLSRRLRRTARRISDSAAMRWLRWHALAMGVDRAPVLMESPNVSVPLTLGASSPIILLPGDWREWESGKLSAVIAHELSHISRNDSRTRALSVAYRTFFWFSPLGWWLEGHLAALGEQASDLAAIAAGAEPAYYAEVLMSFFGAIQTSGARINWQGVSMARAGARSGGRAQDRIEKVLSSPASVSGRRRARLLIPGALAAAPLLWLTAATRPVLVASPAVALQQEAQWPAPPPPPAAPVIAPLAPTAPVAPVVGSVRVATVAPPVPAIPSAPVVAPRAPVPPPTGWQEPAPPEPPEPPEPPPAADDDDWTINNFHDGMTFAIVHGDSVMMNGSGDDQDEVRDLQKKIGGDFIWFIHAGNSYVIRDASVVAHARQLYAPMEELGRQQDELGRQQDVLGRKQDEFGRQQDEVRVEVPPDLEARLRKVEDEIRQLGGTATQDDLGRLQGELGDLQGYLGDLQGKAGDAQGDLGRKQSELGAQQGELGRKQGELGRRQGELARENARKMQDVLKQALADGKAQRAPE